MKKSSCTKPKLNKKGAIKKEPSSLKNENTNKKGARLLKPKKNKKIRHF